MRQPEGVKRPVHSRSLQAGGQAAPPAEVPYGVGTGASGDREQPGAGAGITPEGGQRPVGPKIDLLGDVVGLVPADELGAEPPHLALAGPDPAGKSQTVAGLGGQEERGEIVRGRASTRRASPRQSWGTPETTHT